jgi:hypothetical protein
MKRHKLKTEIQRPDLTGHHLFNYENKALPLSATSNHPRVDLIFPDSRTLHAQNGVL